MNDFMDDFMYAFLVFLVTLFVTFGLYFGVDRYVVDLGNAPEGIITMVVGK